MIRHSVLALFLFFSYTAYCQSTTEDRIEHYHELDSLISDHIEDDYSVVLSLSQDLINRATQEKNDCGRSKGLSYKAFALMKIGNYEQSRSVYIKAIALTEEVIGNEHPDYASLLVDFGELNNLSGSYVEALKVLRQAMKIYENGLGEQHPDFSRVLNDMAYAYESLGSYDKALSLHLDAIALREKTLGKDHPDYGISLTNLAGLYESMGNYRKSLPLYLEAAEVFKNALGEEHSYYSIVLNNLAYLYEVSGDYDKALSLYLQCKDIDERVLGREHPEYATSLNNLAVIYTHIGDFGKALPLVEQSTAIDEKTLGKEHPSYAISLHNLATLHDYMGNYEKALPLMLQAKEVREKVFGEKHPQFAFTLNSLALLYMSMGNPEKALSPLLQAKDIYEKANGKLHPEYARSLDDLADLYESTGNYSNALSLYKEAISIRERLLGSKHPDYATSVNSLSELYIKTGNYNLAWRSLNEAMNSASDMDISITFDNAWSDHLLMANYASPIHAEAIIRSLGIAYELLEKDHNISDLLNKQALVADLANALLVMSRNQVSDERDKLRMLSLSHNWLQKSLRVLIPEIDNKKAFNLSDQNKSVLLLQATKSELVYRLGQLPDSLIWEDRRLLESRSELQARLLEQNNTAETDSLRRLLIDVNQNIDCFVKMVEEQYPKYHKIKYQQVDAKVQDVQKLLDPNTALLEYVVGDSIVHLFWVEKDKVQWFKSFISNQELKDRIKSLHSSLSDYKSDQSFKEYTENAYWFYQKLVAPVLKDRPEITDLVIITDGELGHLPFETFLVEKASSVVTNYRGLHYLLNDYNISYNYSATLWKENIEAGEPINNGQIFGVAASYDNALDSSMLALRLPTDQWTRASISPLPGAREEVKILQKKYKGLFAFDSLASEKRVKEVVSDFSILHFATHGILDTERPVLSSLALTEDNDTKESNFWQAHEISKERLNADLVVLSACETGYGKFEKGNGIASLARAFMYAGAPSLVVSLWQVRDNNTSELMKNFYDNLDQGMKKDEALRKAKLEYIKSADEVFVHPAYWAPFIMIGKTDVVEIERKDGLAVWQIAMVMIVFFAILGIILIQKWRKR